jgi:hypothetical protein
MSTGTFSIDELTKTLHVYYEEDKFVSVLLLFSCRTREHVHVVCTSWFYQEIFVNCIICVFTSSSYRIQVLVLWRETEELRVRVIAFNATFNNISGISCRSVLLVEETGVPRVNHRPAANHWQIVSHNVVSSIPRHSNSQR